MDSKSSYTREYRALDHLLPVYACQVYQVLHSNLFAVEFIKKSITECFQREI